MTTIYPAGIDNSSTLPPAIDNSTSVSATSVNNLRSTIIAIEATLGINPQTVYGSVANRLAAIESAITSGSSVIFGGDLSGTSAAQKVIGIQGVPVSNTLPTTGQVLQFNGSHYVPTSGGGGGFTAAGDLSGSSSSQVVIGLRGVSIDSTPPTSGLALIFDGTNWSAGRDFHGQQIIAGGLLLDSGSIQISTPGDGIAFSSNFNSYALAPSTTINGLFITDNSGTFPVITNLNSLSYDSVTTNSYNLNPGTSLLVSPSGTKPSAVIVDSGSKVVVQSGIGKLLSSNNGSPQDPFTIKSSYIADPSTGFQSISNITPICGAASMFYLLGGNNSGSYGTVVYGFNTINSYTLSAEATAMVFDSSDTLFIWAGTTLYQFNSVSSGFSTPITTDTTSFGNSGGTGTPIGYMCLGNGYLWLVSNNSSGDTLTQIDWSGTQVAATIVLTSTNGITGITYDSVNSLIMVVTKNNTANSGSTSIFVVLGTNNPNVSNPIVDKTYDVINNSSVGAISSGGIVVDGAGNTLICAEFPIDISLVNQVSSFCIVVVSNINTSPTIVSITNLRINDEIVTCWALNDIDNTIAYGLGNNYLYEFDSGIFNISYPISGDISFESATGGVIIAPSNNPPVGSSLIVTGYNDAVWKLNGVQNISGSYTINPLETFLLINTSSGPATLLLDSSQNTGEIHFIRDVSGNAASNNITISVSGGANIDGASTYVINTNGGAVQLVSDGTNWWSVSKI